MDRHRIDHWLKLVCLFKQRGDATEACKGGLVKLNGQRVKPAAPVKEGDTIEFQRGEILRRVVVAALPDKPVSKEQARTMYIDQTPEQPKPEPKPMHRDKGMGRPTKRERREMERFFKR